MRNLLVYSWDLLKKKREREKYSKSSYGVKMSKYRKVFYAVTVYSILLQYTLMWTKAKSI